MEAVLACVLLGACTPSPGVTEEERGLLARFHASQGAGDVAYARGDREAALAGYREARSAYRELARGYPHSRLLSEVACDHCVERIAELEPEVERMRAEARRPVPLALPEAGWREVLEAALSDRRVRVSWPHRPLPVVIDGLANHTGVPISWDPRALERVRSDEVLARLDSQGETLRAVLARVLPEGYAFTLEGRSVRVILSDGSPTVVSQGGTASEIPSETPGESPAAARLEALRQEVRAGMAGIRVTVDLEPQGLAEFLLEVSRWTGRRVRVSARLDDAHGTTVRVRCDDRPALEVFEGVLEDLDLGWWPVETDEGLEVVVGRRVSMGLDGEPDPGGARGE